MIPTTQCLARAGFWSRSLEELKTFTRKTVAFEGIKRPTKPKPLISFDRPDSIDECKVMGDKDIGGFSQSHLAFRPASHTQPAHARFHGRISIELPPDRPDIQRTGFAGWRTWEAQTTLFGRPVWDIDAYAYLAIRCRSDARKYYVNLQTESIVPTDIHQHRLFAKRPGHWETVLIRWNDFVRTNHGVVVEPQRELLRQKVKTVGISLIDRVPGPFDLSIAKIWATNWLDEAEIRESEGDPVEETRKSQVT